MHAARPGPGGWLALAAALLPLASVPSAQGGESGQPLVVASRDVAVVHTGSGSVQGFVREGIQTWRGIPYATAARFMAPQRAKAWEGTRPALSYGNTCPQAAMPLGEPQTFIADTRFWPASEDCLNLNIWSPGAGAGKHRPIMVWLHGGGYSSGSSMELPVYDGTNLSRKGDVVVVSVNHRLNVLGFLDLSAYGDAYAQSANVGMLDIVEALRWVRDNIAQFGGDPGNVTIFGQSGGGGKVATLMASPLARGLFHKAIIQSGAPGTFPSPYADRTVARRVAALTLLEAGLGEDQVAQLAAIPYERLVAAANRALEIAGKELPSSSATAGRFGLSWNPVVDGDFLPAAPFGSQAPDASKGVPLLVGSTLSEFQNFPNPLLRGREGWGEGEVREYFRKVAGEHAEELPGAYRRAWPQLPPNAWPLVDTRFRSAVLRTAALKAAQQDAVYCYLFAWRSPVLDYAWAAGHSSELAFMFDNAALGAQSSGGGPAVDRLTALVSEAWVRFARTGKPGHPGLPAWPAYTGSNPATMIFDDHSTLAVGHDADLLRLQAR